MASLNEGLRALARSVKHSPPAGSVPRHVWAVVHSLSPLSVVFELDDSAQPREVTANAVGPVMVGQRVRVETQRKKVTIVGVGPVPWQTPAMLNGWEDYGGSYAPVGWRIVPHGIQIRGLIRRGTVGEAAFSIDPGLIPHAAILGAITWTGAVVQQCRITVEPHGAVVPDTGANPNWVALDGLIIPA